MFFFVFSVWVSLQERLDLWHLELQKSMQAVADAFVDLSVSTDSVERRRGGGVVGRSGGGVGRGGGGGGAVGGSKRACWWRGGGGFVWVFFWELVRLFFVFCWGGLGVSVGLSCLELVSLLGGVLTALLGLVFQWDTTHLETPGLRLPLSVPREYFQSDKAVQGMNHFGTWEFHSNGLGLIKAALLPKDQHF